ANVTPVTAAGGTGTLSYSVSPTLPAGLSLSTATGTIAGTTTTAAAQATYTVTATDSASPAHTATATFALTVNASLSATATLATTTLVAGDVTNFTPVTASGGVGTHTYSVTPNLPAGLSMSGTTGAITGTPTAESTQSTYTVSVADSATPEHSVTETFTLTVLPSLAAVIANPRNMTPLGDTVAYTPVSASGGQGPLTYSVSPSLPAGLSYDSATGAITGTASTASTATTYTVTTSDSATPAHTRTDNFRFGVSSNEVAFSNDGSTMTGYCNSSGMSVSFLLERSSATGVEVRGAFYSGSTAVRTAYGNTTQTSGSVSASAREIQGYLNRYGSGNVSFSYFLLKDGVFVDKASIPCL
ncbi:putative Ig domain-containing protein, partial [Pseudomonas caspiana]